ncbi:PA14 domain-containing protein [Bacillus cereus]|nr:PA14 domain-containing protein [Bacillus cereus]
MKKIFTSVVTCTLLASMISNGNIHSIYAENNNKTINTTKTQPEEVDRSGLIGYYFKGKDFNNLLIFASTRNNTLMYDQQTANTLVTKQQQEYHSIRWVGLVQSKETGDFTFQLSDDKNAIIEIDGKIVSRKGNDKQTVHLEKGKVVPIKIEYQSDENLTLNSTVFKDLKLFKVDEKNQAHQIQQDELKNPEFNKKETKEFLSKASKMELFSSKETKNDDDDIDTDGDSIPDGWEENGYTIQRKVAVKWDDSLAEKGYLKYVSNPYEAHTVGDPYTDYEKAAKDIPLANAKETFNPLVAAFPSVNVGLEKVVISKNEDMSSSVGSNSSENWSYTNTEGVDVSTGWEGIGPKVGVSFNYQHSETVAKEWGSSTEDTSHINGAQSAFLNANVRYYNVGTGAIYDVKPTTSFVLDGTTIGTIKAKENTTALSLSPGDSYPKRGQNGIAINTMDDFNSHPISLNKDQLSTYMSNKKPILMETNQTEGKYAIKDVNGQTVIDGNWNGIQQQIENRTASIIVNTGEGVTEKRVTGKNYTDPEDLTPELTLKEALKLAYPDEITEKDGLLFYNDKPIYEEAVQSYVDEYTAKQIKKQLNDNTGKFKDVKKLYDVKLEPKMNFTIKLASLYDGAEDGTNLGKWYYTYNSEKGNTGKRKYGSHHPDASLVLYDDSKKKMNQNAKYYVSFYMKADKDIPVTIKVDGEKKLIASETVNMNNKGYQRVNILVENLKENPIRKLTVVGDYKTEIYWDDVAFTEIGASTITNKFFTDEEIKTIFADNDAEIDYLGDSYPITYTRAWYSVTFKNINPIKNYVTKYKLKIRPLEQGSGSGVERDFENIPINNDGSVKLDMSEKPVSLSLLYFGSIIKNINAVDIYAITNDGREVLVYSSDK